MAGIQDGLQFGLGIGVQDVVGFVDQERRAAGDADLAEDGRRGRRPDNVGPRCQAGEQLQKRGLAAVGARALDGQARGNVDLQVDAVDGVGENAPQDRSPQECDVGADIAADLGDNRVQYGGNVGDRVRPRCFVRTLKRAFLLRPGDPHGNAGVALFIQRADFPADQLRDAFTAALPCSALEIAGLIDDQVDGAFRQAKRPLCCRVEQRFHQCLVVLMKIIDVLQPGGSVLADHDGLRRLERNDIGDQPARRLRRDLNLRPAVGPAHHCDDASPQGIVSRRARGIVVADKDNRRDIVWHVDTSQSGDPGKRNGVFRTGCPGRQGILDAFADKDFLGPRVAEADEAVTVPVVRSPHGAANHLTSAFFPSAVRRVSWKATSDRPSQ